MLKRSLTIGLAIVFLYNVAGYYPVFEVRRFINSLEMHCRSASQFQAVPLEKFTFTPESYRNIRWMKEGREFKIGDMLYDVVRIQRTPGKVVLYCINDSFERQLMAAYDRHVTDQVKDNALRSKPKQKLPQKVVKDLFVLVALSGKPTPANGPAWPDTEAYPSCIPREIPDPPPRSVS